VEKLVKECSQEKCKKNDLAQIKKIIGYAEKNFVEKSRLLSYTLIPQRLDIIRKNLADE